ncbi:ABC transporter ATP-binding protein [Sporichthya brevicatena]|uniref:ABC transporter ATP-binding protein n=2 Tax=Sporichthya brevicatena TaxID=171442 RepID=A0ABP3RUE6_9ACTN
MRLTGITAGYEDTTVLRGVDLTIPDNAVVALLGPNGAGKTTLLRVASGLLRPWSGTIELDGRDVTGQPSHALAAAGVCHVPEGRGVFPGLTVDENLRLQAPSRTAVAERVLPAFPRLGERLTQRAGSLSGGEQQMLALAHAYTGRHSAVLLDEVSMGLAPRIVDEIFEHLKVLAASGTSLLLVEQYVKRALELADYVYVLRRGQIEFAGEPWQLGTDAILSSYLGESS